MCQHCQRGGLLSIFRKRCAGAGSNWWCATSGSCQDVGKKVDLLQHVYMCVYMLQHVYMCVYMLQHVLICCKNAALSRVVRIFLNLVMN